jgi:hypothetical protein
MVGVVLWQDPRGMEMAGLPEKPMAARRPRVRRASRPAVYGRIRAGGLDGQFRSWAIGVVSHELGGLIGACGLAASELLHVRRAPRAG